MRLPLTTLTLLLGTATAFVPSIPSSSLVSSKNQQQLHHVLSTNNHSSCTSLAAKPVFPTPKVTSKTPIANDTVKRKNLLEARRCLLEIELAAAKARDYLSFMQDVAQVVRRYLREQEEEEASTSVPLVMKEAEFLNVVALHNVEEAQDYLDNIEKATAHAMDYIESLQDVQQEIRAYIAKFEENYQRSKTMQAQEEVAQAEFHIQDLEETAESARDYLKYLQTVTGVVQQYLADPNLQGIVIEDFMLAVQPAGMKTLQDFLPNKEEKKALSASSPSSGKAALPPTSRAGESMTKRNALANKKKKKMPPLYLDQTTEPHETIDWSHYKAPQQQTTRQLVESSTDNDASAKPATTTSSASYLDQMTLESATCAVGKKAVSTTYLDNMKTTSSLTNKGVPPSYLDQMGAPHESVDWSQFEAPKGCQASAPADSSVVEPAHKSDSTTPMPSVSTSSYLDQMSSTSSIALGRKATVPMSYLDTMSATVNSRAPESVQKDGPQSYLDQMATQPKATVDWSQFKAPKPTTSTETTASSTATASPPHRPDSTFMPAARSASYRIRHLNQLGSPSATSKKTVLASYLDTAMASTVNNNTDSPCAASFRLRFKSRTPSSSSVTAASTSYLESVTSKPSSAATAKKEAPPSYLDQMTAPHETVDWSQFKSPQSSDLAVSEPAPPGKSSDSAPKPATSTRSYLDQMTSSWTSAPSKQAAPTSYLDTVASPLSSPLSEESQSVEEQEEAVDSSLSNETHDQVPHADDTPKAELPPLESQPASSVVAQPVLRPDMMAAHPGSRMLDQRPLSAGAPDKIPGTLKFFASRVAPHLSDPETLPKPRDPTWNVNDVVTYVPVKGGASLYWAVTFWPERKRRFHKNDE